MPATLHDFPKRKALREYPEIHTPVWKAVCLDCDWGYDGIQTYNAVAAKATAHSIVNRHDVEIRFSVVDCLAEVMRAEDLRR